MVAAKLKIGTVLQHLAAKNNISVRPESRALRMERRKLKPCLVQTISYRMPLTEHA